MMGATSPRPTREIVGAAMREAANRSMDRDASYWSQERARALRSAADQLDDATAADLARLIR